MNRARRWTWRIAGLLVATVAGIAIIFWARPLSVFQVFNRIEMYIAGARSRFITVQGFRIHYYALGPDTGAALVLVHGLGGRAEDWENLAPYLARAGYRVYLPDLPGFGQSERPQNFSYSVSDQARLVVQFMDAVGLEQVDLGGWSMGGWIAQLAAGRHPDRVRRLVLFDSAGLAVKPDWDTRLFTPDSPEEVEKLDALLMPHPPSLPRFIAEDILRTSREHAWVMRRSMATMLEGKETTDALLPRLEMPVLLVWGELDQITPLSEGTRMHELMPQSQLKIVPGCGHLAPNECAGPIAPTVLAFLQAGRNP